jgi:integrase
MVSKSHDEWSVIQNEHSRLENEVESGDIVKEDAQAIEDFIEHDQGKNKLTTVRGHFTVLRTAARRATVPLVESDEDDLSSLLSSMRSGAHPDVKDGGIGVSNYQKAFRVFYRYHSELGVDPTAIEIDEERGRQVGADDLLFQEDVDALLRNCYTLRDRALLAMGLATGQRIDALRTLRNKHVTIRGQTMDITLNEEEGTLKGASGSKPLLWAKHYLKAWYRNHPYKDDPEAALFCPTPDAPLPDDRNPRGPIHYQTVRDKLHRIGKKAGVEPEKFVYPHLLRHTAITRMVLEGLNEQKIKKIAGWSADSSQFEIYVSMSDELSNDSIREDLGLPTSGEVPVLGRPTLQECPECHDRLPEDPDHCPTCQVPLTTYEAVAGEYETEIPSPDPTNLVEDMSQKEMLKTVKAIEEKLSE